MTVKTEPLIFKFDNSYARLPERFYARLQPTPVSAPRLVRINEKLAWGLGLDPTELATPEGIAFLSGNRAPRNSEPIAMAYAGHQFGRFVSRLGDGRALLLGEIIGRDGHRYDIQLKGSGPTPFSRRGDGRAAVGPVLREYIVSEAMAALGIPTTRALAAVMTGDTVQRDVVLPGAVLTRVASSHIRIGTFQYFAARGDVDGIRQLADYVIARHYPSAADTAHPYRALLDLVIARQAALVAHWLLVGFIHGVMNTDNMSIAGETIDFGPCAFLDAYDPGKVYSSIDTAGRYAYGNQPQIALWNLARLAEALSPLLGADENGVSTAAQEALEGFSTHFEEAYATGLRRKLGLFQSKPDDLLLARDLFARMASNGADFTLTFRGLCSAAGSSEGDAEVRHLFSDPNAFDEWAVRWRQRLKEEPAEPSTRQQAMRGVNPAFIPRNHLVEEVISAALSNADLSPFETLLSVVSMPYEDQPAFARYRVPPRPDQIVRQTFCGT